MPQADSLIPKPLVRQDAHVLHCVEGQQQWVLASKGKRQRNSAFMNGGKI